MTKKHLASFILFLTLLATGTWFLFKKDAVSKNRTASVRTPASVPDALLKVPHLNGRRVLNLPSGKEKEALKKLKVSNTVSDHWQENVEKTLKVQGGDALKKIDVEKMESLIWTQHGLALNVESLRISVTNQKEETTSFRAMVDSQTGKILQTWDHPIIDPINPRENFGIKLDPRYLND